MPAEGLQDPRYCLSERLFRVRRQFLPLPLALLLKVQAAESDARKAPPCPQELALTRAVVTALEQRWIFKGKPYSRARCVYTRVIYRVP
jgi:hypothetical protein